MGLFHFSGIIIMEKSSEKQMVTKSLLSFEAKYSNKGIVIKIKIYMQDASPVKKTKIEVIENHLIQLFLEKKQFNIEIEKNKMDKIIFNIRKIILNQTYFRQFS